MSDRSLALNLEGTGRFLEARRLLGRARRSANVLAGTLILLIVAGMAIFAPVLSKYDPLEMAPIERLKAPGAQYLFGTDKFGRDVFTRVLYGAQISLQVGFVSVALATGVGTVLGLMAGYYGGLIDTIIMRLIDVMLAFPGVLMALAIVAVLGPSLPNVMLAVGISSIPTYTRVVRGGTLSVKQTDFVTAAILIGCRPWRIMFRHILPNVLASIIVITTTGVAGAIIAGAALSFLGLGAQPPTPEWGSMLNEGRGYLSSAWWVTTFPGLAIMVTVVAINLLGDGLRDILDPRLRI